MTERDNQTIWNNLSPDAQRLAALIADSELGHENPHFLEVMSRDPDDAFDLSRAKQELADAGLLIEKPDIEWRRDTGIDPDYVKSYDNDIWAPDHKRIAEEPKYGLDPGFKDSIT
jgi:hypothetical protein